MERWIDGDLSPVGWLRFTLFLIGTTTAVLLGFGGPLMLLVWLLFWLTGR